MTKTKNTDNTFDPASQRNQDNSSPTPSESTPDPTITTPEEEKQFIEQGKLQTEQMDPEANQIEREFDSYPEQPSTPKKGNKGITFQSTLKAWTLVTPKDKMKQLRKVKAQAKAAQEAAQEAAATKKAQMAIQTSITNSTSVKDSDSKALVQPSSTVQDKVTFATKVLATAASTTVQQTTSDAKETSKEVSNSKEGSDTSSPPATTVTKVVKKKKPKKKPNLTRPFNTYYILKLKIQASTNSVKELTTKMQTFLQAIQELDGSLIIYRYRDNIPIHAIMSKEEIPTNIHRFKEFLVVPIHLLVKVMFGHQYGLVTQRNPKTYRPILNIGLWKMTLSYIRRNYKKNNQYANIFFYILLIRSTSKSSILRFLQKLRRLRIENISLPLYGQ